LLVSYQKKDSGSGRERQKFQQFRSKVVDRTITIAELPINLELFVFWLAMINLRAR